MIIFIKKWHVAINLFYDKKKNDILPQILFCGEK